MWPANLTQLWGHYFTVNSHKLIFLLPPTKTRGVASGALTDLKIQS